MKITLDLPEHLVRSLKLRALNEGRRMKDVAAEVFRKGLNVSATKAKAVGERGKLLLPLFPTKANAPAKRMSAEQLLELEQQALHQGDCVVST